MDRSEMEQGLYYYFNLHAIKTAVHGKITKPVGVKAKAEDEQ